MTTDDLGAHQGLVRCGRCREVFNASWNLVDEVPGVSGEEPVPEQNQIAVEPTVTTHTELDPVADNDGEEQISAAAAEPPLDTPPTLTIDQSEITQLLPPVAEAESAPTESTGNMESHAGMEEEIIIEAPAMLWDFEDTEPALDRLGDRAISDSDPDASPSADSLAKTPTAGRRLSSSPGALSTAPSADGPAVPQRRRITASRPAADVKLVELPNPQPIRTAAWGLGTVLALLVIVLQAREFFLDDLAQVSALRPTLTTMCRYISCTVPARSEIESIDLVGTSVNQHPEVPGALRVSVNLMNRAGFEQLYPPLEITLTDKGGGVVGRRTYLPTQYGRENNSTLPPRVVQRVDLDLGRPAEAAVGYEIQLVSR